MLNTDIFVRDRSLGKCKNILNLAFTLYEMTSVTYILFYKSLLEPSCQFYIKYCLIDFIL